MIIKGWVQSGEGNASHWLKLFNNEYIKKIWMPVFPGTLNLTLDVPFDWYSPSINSQVVWFGNEEYGGARDILLLPCVLKNLENIQGFLWSTTTAAREIERRFIIEVIASISLRKTFGLKDGDLVEIELKI